MLAQLEVTVDGTTQTLPVLKPVSIIGKRETCDLVLRHKSVSSQHAKLIVMYNGVTVEDLGSTNGTILRGQRVTGAVELKDGDELQFGAVKARLILPKQEEKGEQEPVRPIGRRRSESVARQPEILKVLSDDLAVRDRLSVLNKEFASRIFIPSIHWKVRFFLFIAGALVVTALMLSGISSLLAGARIDPKLLGKLRELAAENIDVMLPGGKGEFSSRTLSLAQNPEVIGFFLMDDSGAQIYPRRDQKCPVDVQGFNASTFSGPDSLRGPGDTWYLVEAIVVDNTRLGLACLQLDRKPVPSGGNLPLALAVLILIFLIVIGYLFIGLAGRIITHPIARFIVEIDEMRMGQRAEFSRFGYFPELDRLAQSLAAILHKKEP